jgi:hypothetical protein
MVPSPLSLEDRVGMLLMAPLFADWLDDLTGRFRCGSLLTWAGAFGDSAPESITDHGGQAERSRIRKESPALAPGKLQDSAPTKESPALAAGKLQDSAPTELALTIQTC